MNKLFLKIIILFTLFLTGYHSVADVIHVDPTKSQLNDGSTWENATNNLHNAYNLAQPGDSIWMKAGEYNLFTQGELSIEKSISIFGGFSGGETMLSDRILSDGNRSILKSLGNGLTPLKRLFTVPINDIDFVIDGFDFQEHESVILAEPGVDMFDFRFSNNRVGYFGNDLAIEYGTGFTFSNERGNILFRDNIFQNLSVTNNIIYSSFADAEIDYIFESNEIVKCAITGSFFRSDGANGLVKFIDTRVDSIVLSSNPVSSRSFISIQSNKEALIEMNQTKVSNIESLNTFISFLDIRSYVTTSGNFIDLNLNDFEMNSCNFTGQFLNATSEIKRVEIDSFASTNSEFGLGFLNYSSAFPNTSVSIKNSRFEGNTGTERTTRFFSIENYRGSQISDISFDNVVFLENSMNSPESNLIFYNNRGFDNVSNVNIKDCFFDKNSEGLVNIGSNDALNTVIENCTFKKNDSPIPNLEAQIRIKNLEQLHVEIIDCEFDYSLSDFSGSSLLALFDIGSQTDTANVRVENSDFFGSKFTPLNKRLMNIGSSSVVDVLWNNNELADFYSQASILNFSGKANSLIEIKSSTFRGDPDESLNGLIYSGTDSLVDLKWDDNIVAGINTEYRPLLDLNSGNICRVSIDNSDFQGVQGSLGSIFSPLIRVATGQYSALKMSSSTINGYNSWRSLIDVSSGGVVDAQLNSCVLVENKLRNLSYRGMFRFSSPDSVSVRISNTIVENNTLENLLDVASAAVQNNALKNSVEDQNLFDVTSAGVVVLELDQSVFSGNSADRSSTDFVSRLFRVNEANQIAVDNCQFIKNSFTDLINVSKVDSAIIINKTIFRENNTTHLVEDEYSLQKKVEFNECQFLNNKMESFASRRLTKQSYLGSDIRGNQFFRNSIDDLLVENCDFSNNISMNNEPLFETQYLEMRDSKITGANSSSLISFTSDSSKVLRSSFSDNQCQEGLLISSRCTYLDSLVGNEFKNNTTDTLLLSTYININQSNIFNGNQTRHALFPEPLTQSAADIGGAFVELSTNCSSRLGISGPPSAFTPSALTSIVLVNNRTPNNLLPSKEVINGTISGNNFRYSGITKMSNSIYDQEGDFFDRSATLPIVRYSNFKGGYPGTGNTDLEVQFTNPISGDFRLSCNQIDFFDIPTDVLNFGSIDVLGNPRVVNTKVDLGAYEFQGNIEEDTLTPNPSFEVPAIRCTNDELVFENTTPLINNFSYIWKYENGEPEISKLEDGKMTYDSLGFYNISLTARNKCGAEREVIQAVEIFPTSRPEINFPTTVCPGDTIDFDAGTNGCNNYQWNVVNGQILEGAQLSSSKVYFDSDDAGKVARLTLNATSCGGVDGCELPQTIEVPVLPNVVEISGSLTHCELDTAEYYFTTDEKITGLLYDWKISNGIILGSTRGYNLDTIKVLWGSHLENGTLSLTVKHEVRQCEIAQEITVDLSRKLEILTDKDFCGFRSDTVMTNYPGDFTYSIAGLFNSVSIERETGVLDLPNEPTEFTVRVRSEVDDAFCNRELEKTYRLFPSPMIESIEGDTLVNDFEEYTYRVVSNSDSLAFPFFGAPIFQNTNPTLSPNTSDSLNIQWTNSERPKSVNYVIQNVWGCLSDTAILPVQYDTLNTIIGEVPNCVRETATFSSQITDWIDPTYLWIVNGVDTVGVNVERITYTFDRVGPYSVELLVESQGRKYRAVKSKSVRQTLDSGTLTGDLTIAPEGGTYTYRMENPSIHPYFFEVVGGTSLGYDTVTNSITVNWPAAGDHFIKWFIRPVDSLLCPSEIRQLEVKNAELLTIIPEVGDAICLNTDVPVGIEVDNFTTNIRWEIVSGNAGFEQRTDFAGNLKIGNTPGEIILRVSYDRFGPRFNDFTFNVSGLPNPTITVEDICNQTPSTNTVNEEFVAYNWFSQPLNNLVETGKTFTSSQAGAYKLEVIDAEGCQGEALFSLEKIEYTNARILVQTGRISKICPSSGQEIYTFETPSSPNYIYEWSLNGGVVTGSNPLFNYSMNKAIPQSNTLRLRTQLGTCQSEAVEVRFGVKDDCIVPNNTVDDTIQTPYSCTSPTINFQLSGCSDFNLAQVSGPTDQLSINWGDGSSTTNLNDTKVYEEVGDFNIVVSRACQRWREEVRVPFAALFGSVERACVGSPVSFKDNSLSLTGATSVAYRWSFGDAQEVSGGNQDDRSVTHTFITGGTYEVNLSVDISYQGKICTYSYSKNITIDSAPVVDFVVGVPSCGGRVYSFENTSQLTTQTANYIWEVENLVRNEENLNYSFQFSGIQNVTLEVIDDLGCRGNKTEILSVPVFKPELLITSSETDPYLCPDSTLTLTAPISANTYEWFRNGVKIEGADQQDFISTIRGTYTAQISDGVCLRETNPFEVNGYLPDSLDIVFDKNPCIGSSILATIDKYDPRFHDIQWVLNGAISGFGTSQLVSIRDLSEQNITAVVTETSTTGCAYRLPLKGVTPLGLPVVPTFASSMDHCQGDSMEVVLANTDVFNRYVLNEKDEFLPNESGQFRLKTADVEWEGNVTFNVLAIDTNGCQSNQSFTERFKPNLDLRASVFSTSLCEFSSNTFDVNFTDPSLLGSEFSLEPVQWLNNNSGGTLGSSSSLSIDQITRDFDGPIQAVVKYAQGNPCPSVSNILTVNVKEALPIPQIIGAESICEGNIINLSTDAQGDFVWSTGDTSRQIAVLEDANIVVIATHPISQCESRADKVVVFHPNPDLGFVGGGLFEVCGNERLVFEGLRGVLSYQWKLNGTAYGAPNTPLTPRLSGNYTVEATSNSNCTVESDTLRLQSSPCGACEVIVVEDGVNIGSLRDAIVCANNNPGVDYIIFNIEGSSPHQVTIDSALPMIEEGVIVDGRGTNMLSKEIVLSPGSYDKELFKIARKVNGFSLLNLQVQDFENVVVAPSGLESANFEANYFKNNDTVLKTQGRSNNLFFNINRFEGGVGLSLERDQNTLVTNNSFDGNIHSFLALNSSDLRLFKNAFFDQLDTAVMVKQSFNSSIENNNFGLDLQKSSSPNRGISLYANGGVEIKQNSFDSNLENAVVVMSNTIIDRNTFRSNSKDAVLVEGVNNYLTENIFVGTLDGLKAINLNGVGNTNLENPGIDSIIQGKNRITLTGSGVNGDLVEVFRTIKLAQTALTFISEVEVRNNRWSLTLFNGDNYSAADTNYYVTTITRQSNTSELSAVAVADPFVCQDFITNTNNEGTGSFRQQIACANTDAAKDLIQFRLDNTAPKQIILESPVDVVFPVDILASLKDSIQLIPSDNSPLVFGEKSSNASRVQGLVFDGSNAGFEAIAISSRQSNGFILSSSWVRNYAVGLEWINTNKFSVDDCQFFNVDQVFDITGNTNEASITNNVFRGINEPIALEFGTSANNSIQFFQNALYNNTASPLMTLSGSQVVITRNTFGLTKEKITNLNESGVLIASSGSLSNATIQQNTFIQKDTALHLSGDNVKVYSNQFGEINENPTVRGQVALTTEGSLDIQNNLFVHQGIGIKAVSNTDLDILIIRNNLFGIDSTGAPMPVDTGISVLATASAEGFLINQNVIPYASLGMEIGSLMDSLIVTNNLVGRTVSDTLGQVSIGAHLTGSIEQVIFQENEIRNCDSLGILASGLHNHITRNVIQDWETKGIHHLLPNGNNLNARPQFIQTVATYGELSILGTSGSNHKIELFRTDSLGQNAYQLLGTVQSDEFGSWKYSFENTRTEINLIATATDSAGNTSEFSAVYRVVPYLCSNLVTNVMDNGNGSLRRTIECSPFIRRDIFVEIKESLDKEIVLKDSLPRFYSFTDQGSTFELTLFGQDRNDLVPIKVVGDNTFNAIKLQGNGIENVVFEKFDTSLTTLGNNNRLHQVVFNEFQVGLYASQGEENEFDSLTFNSGNQAVILDGQSSGGLFNSTFGNQSLVSSPVSLRSANGFDVSNVTIGQVANVPVEISNSSQVIMDDINGQLPNSIASFVHCDSCVNTSITGDSLVGGENGVVFENSSDSRVFKLKFVGQDQHAIAVSNSQYIQFDTITTRDFGIDQKIINLNYGASSESNFGYPIPTFESASYRRRVIYFKGKSKPNDLVQIYQTEKDTTDARTHYATVKANGLGVFQFQFPVTLTNFNDISFRAFSTENLPGNASELYGNSSEFTDAFNPNLKICFVTSESDDGTEKGTMRYNIDSLVNLEKCNLMLFEVPGNVVNLRPNRVYSDIVGSELNIDGTSQPGYNDRPVVNLSNTGSLANAYSIDNDTADIILQGISYQGFDTTLVIKNVKSFENTLGEFSDFQQSVRFLDSTTQFILLDSNLISSDRADYLVETTVPNIILSNNDMIGGNVHGLLVNSDSALTDGNTFRPLNNNTQPAVFVKQQNQVQLTNDSYFDYLYGIELDRVGLGVEITKNKFRGGQQIAILIQNDSSSLASENTFFESDTAIKVFNSDSTHLFQNTVTSTYLPENPHSGVGIVIDSSRHILVEENRAENTQIGILIQNSDENNLVGNISQGHDRAGIYIDSLSSDNVLASNQLGTALSIDVLEREEYFMESVKSITFESADSVFSRGYGLYLEGDSNEVGTTVEDANLIYRNFRGGVAIKGQFNRLMFNTIAKNDLVFDRPTALAIVHLDSVGNALKSAPVIESYSTVVQDQIYKVWGSSEPKDTIQLFNSNGYYQSAYGYLAQTVANDTGYWEVEVNRSDARFAPQFRTLAVTALATDDSRNTSELSNMLYVGSCYVGNHIDNVDNEYPYPNSLRQATACINSLPEKGKLLVAKPDSRSVAVRRRMSDLKTTLGASIDGKNLAISGDTLTITEGFVDSVNTYTTAGEFIAQVEIEDTHYVWRLNPLFGPSDVQNLHFKFIDTALVVSSDSIQIQSSKFTSIEGLALHVDSNARVVRFDSLLFNNSDKATAVFVDSGASFVDLNASRINFFNRAVIIQEATEVNVSNSAISLTLSPLEIVGSKSVRVTRNTINLSGDSLIFFNDSNLVFSHNIITGVADSLVADFANSNGVSVTGNTIQNENLKIFRFAQVNDLLVNDNKVNSASDYFVRVNDSKRVDILGNEIEGFEKRGVWIQNSDSVWMANNLFKDLDADEEGFIAILDIDKGENSVSNLDKPTPTIVGFEVKLEGACEDEERTSIYLSGTSSPLDTIQLFTSQEFEANDDYREHNGLVGWGRADLAGNWEIKLPREAYSDDASERFVYSVTATTFPDVRTSRESDNFAFNDAHLKIFVTNTNNTGIGSLRDAITQINCSDVYNKVCFEIEEDGPHQIEVIDSILDSLNTYLGFIIDGGTQQEYALSLGQNQWNTDVMVSNLFFSSQAIRVDSALFRIEPTVQVANMVGFELKDAVFGINPKNLNTTISDMTFSNSLIRTDTASLALLVRDSASVSVDQSSFSGYHTPIRLENSKNSTIKNSTFRNSIYGIEIVGGSGLNQIVSDTFGVDSIPVLVKNTFGVTLIDTNSFDALQPLRLPAVIIDNSSNAILANSFFNHTEASIDTTYAIFTLMGNSSNNLVVNNTVGIDSAGNTGDKIVMNLLRVIGDVNSTSNQVFNNEVINLSVPAVIASNTKNMELNENFFGFDQEQRLPDLTPDELANTENVFLLAPGSDSSMIILQNTQGAKVLNNSFINFQDYAVDARNSEGVSIQENKMFSERTSNKGIQLNQDNTALVSNAGFEPPIILENIVLNRTTIELTGQVNTPDVDLLIYEAYQNEIDEDSVLQQSFRYITSVTAGSDGVWSLLVPTDNFGFNDFNRYVAQARKPDQSTSEFSKGYQSDLDLCNISSDVKFFNSLYNPCPGSGFELTVPISEINYNWVATNSMETFTSDQQIFQLDTTAKVKITLSDNSPCTHKEEFEVAFKPSPVQPEFLVTQEAQTNDTIVVVDISNYEPSEEENFEWSVSGGSQIISEDAKFVKFIVDTTGTYLVTHSSQRDGCQVNLTKPVTITESNGSGNPLLELQNNELTPYPNPLTFGEDLTININSSKLDLLELTIINLQGQVIYEYEGEDLLEGSNAYQITIPGVEFAQSESVYILRLVTPTTVLTKSIVVLSSVDD